MMKDIKYPGARNLKTLLMINLFLIIFILSSCCSVPVSISNYDEIILQNSVSQNIPELQSDSEKSQHLMRDGKYTEADLSVAVMGCIVNGPGEARAADFGIAGGKHEGLLFKKGEILRKVKEKELVPQLIKLIEENVEI